mmetsp:Transcript_1974/g.2940  ORF Transcript_1974/g.2940 Transcript_1974/m.2940 type:complete len:107 (+) Transcript_1974:426-746(+)|eukprot:CAMPEP_0170499846 /NCGR_PEP_ID=MMETSP0208-20121228/32853_1 /TAXON_ID=197538 /ORGANISM="Strombidium inclinatum, Strain S3" /LENGTH=106 /DNA_ID=CAMNT_0010777587 /DNA_START=360 /DNA_END=680 /DNA_ORIENTATION=-
MGHSLGANYATCLTHDKPDFFKAAVLMNPLYSFNKHYVNPLTKAKLKAQQLVQVKERHPFPLLDDFIPQEMQDMRDDKSDFYIEKTMSIESYLQIQTNQENVYEEL